VSQRHLSLSPRAAAGRFLGSSAVDPVATEVKKSTNDDESGESSNPFGLTPELLKIANAFEMVGDDKLRHKQLLFMANQLQPMDPASQIPENQVPGCLSTVYIDGRAVKDGDRYRIQFVGDSDGLLTKGLVALLVRGLSDNTADDIQRVDPAFIKKAGIAASLTPGRNNGFLNMLAVMKRKAVELEEEARSAASQEGESSSDGDGGDRPMYRAIVTSLQALKPEALELTDVSHRHAGHAEGGGGGAESHFELNVVAGAFEGLNLVRRHQLIYMLLGDVMPHIHALQIQAKTPAEVQ
jgi:sulfur transfer protein SufE/acid stress-induced BolA-like protein IbaG/YrbA